MNNKEPVLKKKSIIKDFISKYYYILIICCVLIAGIYYLSSSFGFVFFQQNPKIATGNINYHGIESRVTYVNRDGTTYVKTYYNGNNNVIDYEGVGYHFLGWDTDRNTTNPYYSVAEGLNTFNVPDGEVTLYAIYEKNIMDVFPATILDSKATITEVHFIDDLQANIDSRYNSATTKADVTKVIDNVKQGDVKAWLEGTKLYIGGEDTIYLSTGCDEVNSLGLFDGFEAVTLYDFVNADTSLVDNFYYMFANNTALTTLNLSNFNTANSISFYGMFYNDVNLVNLDISSFETGNAESFRAMFNHCEKLTSLNLSHFDTSSATDMRSMFWYCQLLTSLNVSSFDTSNVEDMTYMFGWCKALTSLNLSNFDTSNVTSMYQMFHHAISLTTLDTSSFDTSNVENMGYMFNYCQAATKIYCGHFNTSKVTNMSYMFYHCDSIARIDIASFKTNLVTNMSYMFGNCGSLIAIYYDHRIWSTSAVTDSTAMFTGSTSIVGSGRTAYNADYVDKTYARGDSGYQKGYFWYNAEIPSEYQKLNYIGATGTQYIDTGYYAKSTTGIIVCFNFNDVTTLQQRLFGNTGDFQIQLYINSAGNWAYQYADTTANNFNTGVAADTTRHVLRYNRSSKVTIDGTYNAAISGGATNTASRTLLLFARNHSTIAYYANARIYYFFVYEGSTIIRIYIPAFLKSDTTQVGLYDVITKTFLTNTATTGDNFTKGIYIYS